MFDLPSLPYPMNALEPYISEKLWSFITANITKHMSTI